MRVAGIVAEYNPMHYGHIYHLEETRKISKADFIIAVISGNFTQRGKPAILDKWTRSKIACEAGVDLVLEMPAVYGTGSAETFAKGGVEILEALGICDAISFGSESGDIEDLQFLADFLKNESPEYKVVLKEYLDKGLSYPESRELAVNRCLGMDAGGILKKPNNILAIEYLKHIRAMTPITVKRKGEHNNEEMPSDSGEEYPSASAIRKELLKGNLSGVTAGVPGESYSHIIAHSKEFMDSGKRYFDLLRAVILKTPSEELTMYRGVSEGIENKIKKEIRLHETYEEFAMSLKSKRFTLTAIDRMLLSILLGITKDANPGNELYARVLAANENGAMLLRKMKDSCSIPVVTNINKHEEIPLIHKYDIIATDMYNLIADRDLYEHSDYVMRPCMIDSSFV